MTVEDPIEYYLDGIGQTQVNTKVDLSFARGLRAILRQDPDVVIVITSYSIHYTKLYDTVQFLLLRKTIALLLQSR